MAYEYGHDCPFEAYITNLGKYNEGELVGEWVKFPTTSEDLKKVFERIGIGSKDDFATVYKGNIIKNLIMDCQSYTKYRPNETTGGIFVSWRRKEELPTGA